MPCDFQALLDDSACLAALPTQILDVLQAQLLCSISGSVATGPIIVSGNPEGVVTASPPTFAWDSVNKILYIKDTGTNTNTGWRELIA